MKTPAMPDFTRAQKELFEIACEPLPAKRNYALDLLQIQDEADSYEEVVDYAARLSRVDKSMPRNVRLMGVGRNAFGQFVRSFALMAGVKGRSHLDLCWESLRALSEDGVEGGQRRALTIFFDEARFLGSNELEGLHSLFRYCAEYQGVRIRLVTIWARKATWDREKRMYVQSFASTGLRMAHHRNLVFAQKRIEQMKQGFKPHVLENDENSLLAQVG